MRLFLIVILINFILLPSHVNAADHQQEPAVLVRYWPDEKTITALADGALGQGFILYYLANKGIENPSLVVRLSKSEQPDSTLAEVFHSIPGNTSVPIQIIGNTIVIRNDLKPAIIMKGRDGQWVHNKHPSFNLDIQLTGRMHSMWGGGYDPVSGPTQWNARVSYDQPAVQILVRDPEQEGLPKWELRSLIPEFAGEGYIRTSYAERRCSTSTQIDPGISPLWPFVAVLPYSFEQSQGIFAPPIQVDWAAGRIVRFTELVTVRNQNCSYSFYSINPLSLDSLNHPNFETPFAFYDLSGQGQGYPNMILRTERFPAYDPLSDNIDPGIQLGEPVNHDFVRVRYSWRNDIGDWHWDYKVEVLGQHAYTFETPIADGLATIDAPPYDIFPRWVVEHAWPIVTFIDTEGFSYNSSEGIYEWSPSNVGMKYILGWDRTPSYQAFTNLTTGFRGEYRVGQERPPRLYFSSIDNRLHLLGADGGMTHLTTDQVLRVYGLGNSNVINSWVRERVSVIPGDVASIDPSRPGFVEEALYVLPNHLLYIAPNSISLRQNTYQQELFEIDPPTDAASWRTFRERIRPFAEQKRDPLNLRSWLDAFPGPTLTLPGASVADVRQTATGFRFILTLPPDFKASSNDVLDLSGLEARRYAVIYNGDFTITPLTPPVLSAVLAPPSLVQHSPGILTVSLRNEGLQDLAGATLELWAASPDKAATMVVSQTIDLLAQEPVTTTLEWAPPQAGSWSLTPKIRQPDGLVTEFSPTKTQVQQSSPATPTRIISAGGIYTLLPFIIAALFGLAVLGGILIWQQWHGSTPMKEQSHDSA